MKLTLGSAGDHQVVTTRRGRPLGRKNNKTIAREELAKDATEAAALGGEIDCMQIKDIPNQPVLVFLVAIQPRWGTWFGDEHANSVTRAMPGIPRKLALAKVRSMIRKGLVSGCGCGCRGDFEITDKGRAALITA